MQGAKSSALLAGVVLAMALAGCGGIETSSVDNRCAQTSVAVVKGLPSAYGLAVDDSDVYWTDNESGTVMAVPKNGGTPRTLASKQIYPQFIAIDSGHVYWGNAYSPDGFIGRVPKKGGPVSIVAQVAGIRSIALDVSTAYFTEYGDGAPVSSAPLEGGPTTILADSQPNAAGIAVHEGVVYWANQGSHDAEGGIMRIPATGGTSSVLVGGQGSPGAIAVDSSGIYWGNEQPTRGVMRAPLAGGSPTQLAPDPVRVGLAIDDDRVFFANLEGEIKSVPKTGGATCTIAAGQDQPWMLALDAEFVYWSNVHVKGTSGSVWKAAKSCCE